jgi:hypothetical protein
MVSLILGSEDESWLGAGRGGQIVRRGESLLRTYRTTLARR